MSSGQSGANEAEAHLACAGEIAGRIAQPPLPSSRRPKQATLTQQRPKHRQRAGSEDLEGSEQGGISGRGGQRSAGVLGDERHFIGVWQR